MWRPKLKHPHTSNTKQMQLLQGLSNLSATHIRFTWSVGMEQWKLSRLRELRKKVANHLKRPTNPTLCFNSEHTISSWLPYLHLVSQTLRHGDTFKRIFDSFLAKSIGALDQHNFHCPSFLRHLEDIMVGTSDIRAKIWIHSGPARFSGGTAPRLQEAARTSVFLLLEIVIKLLGYQDELFNELQHIQRQMANRSSSSPFVLQNFLSVSGSSNQGSCLSFFYRSSKRDRAFGYDCRHIVNYYNVINIALRSTFTIVDGIHFWQGIYQSLYRTSFQPYFLPLPSWQYWNRGSDIGSIRVLRWHVKYWNYNSLFMISVRKNERE